MLTIRQDQCRIFEQLREEEFCRRLRFFLAEQLAEAGPDGLALPVEDAIQLVMKTAASIGIKSEENAACCVILYLLADASDDPKSAKKTIEAILKNKTASIEERIEQCYRIYN
ncbi:hypothetical protein [Azospirillum thiophilum]|uniref:hypothetical protein n=1 Tax=Azospirillum thiophilum TaxID=528244 RepID=UPI00118740A1|nr:hypothetical protein [Azospirillum thiophilum]